MLLLGPRPSVIPNSFRLAFPLVGGRASCRVRPVQCSFHYAMTYLLDSLDDVPKLVGTAVTVGSYDGVHRGHRAMIARLRAEAQARGLSSLLVTFHPHHRVFFGREHTPFLLTDRDEKVELLLHTGMEAIVVLPFAQSLARMSAREFVRDILSERLGCRLLLVGHDQAIGRDQRRGPAEIGAIAGSVGIDVASVEPIRSGQESVSSTSIRTLLRYGDVNAAAELLGYRYLLTGQVAYGQARGRTLGYPTANLTLRDPFKLLPSDGVYVAMADPADGGGNGMLYIGRRPTFGDGPRMVELFLLDWEGDLYGRSLRVHLVERLRGDMTFGSSEELTRQIRLDEARTRELLRSQGKSPVSSLDNAAKVP